MKLRLVTIEIEKVDEKTEELKTEIVTLITNLPANIMTIDDICEIYDYIGGIETNYNTFKNRLNIENYSKTKRITIEQNIYAKFFFYNIFYQYNCYLNMLVNQHMRKKGKNGEEYEYQVNQTNLIRNLKDDLMKVVINPTKKNIQEFTSDLIWESRDEPNKIKKKQKIIKISKVYGIA